jgi:conjugal transfer/entry exclusion protein
MAKGCVFKRVEMKAKEKAEELVEKFYSKYNNIRKEKFYSVEQKRMALIAVDEIINELKNLGDEFQNYDVYIKEYWQEVKYEINQL